MGVASSDDIEAIGNNLTIIEDTLIGISGDVTTLTTQVQNIIDVGVPSAREEFSIVGDDSTVSYQIDHHFNSRNVNLSMYDKATYERIVVDSKFVDDATILLNLDVPLGSGTEVIVALS